MRMPLVLIRSAIARCALLLALLLPGASSAQDPVPTLCDDLGAQPTAIAWAAYVHAGIGWHLGPSELGRSRSGPVREFSVAAHRLKASRTCTESGVLEFEPRPHGLRLELSMAEAYWSPLLDVSAGAGYVHTGRILRWWVTPQVSLRGVSEDSLGVGAGINAGGAVYEWVALRASASHLLGGRGPFNDGWTAIVVASISPAFKREHFESRRRIVETRGDRRLPAAQNRPPSR